MPTTPINFAFMRLARRAEAAEPQMLLETFVALGPLFTLLKSADHQVVFGRRGTGKTHALKYLAQDVRSSGDLAVYVDLRVVGSNVSTYNAPGLSVPERGSRLLADVMAFIHNRLVDDVLTLAEKQEIDFTRALGLLDRLADEITTVRIEGLVEQETRALDAEASDDKAELKAELSSNPRITAGSSSSDRSERQLELRLVERGERKVHLNFGAVHQVLQELIDALPVRRVWVLLDEWSAVPNDLQPLLADLLRRCLFPVTGLVVKIGAIEQLSRFRMIHDDDSYTGIEIGADATADVDLDEFMVFGNDPERSKSFFKQLLYKHVRAALAAEGREPEAPKSADQFVSRGFTQANAFQELVRAAEGVPRDAINVANLAAQAANENAISVPTILTAARQWYLRDKEAAVIVDPDARDLLRWIHDEVIGARRARAFFLEQSEADHPLIASLYNARVLHVIKRGVASYLEPGVRFDVYAIDYGAYVHLRSTDKAVEGLFKVETDEEAGFVEVPADDYRSIRRAILRLDDYRSAQRADTETV